MKLPDPEQWQAMLMRIGNAARCDDLDCAEAVRLIRMYRRAQHTGSARCIAAFTDALHALVVRGINLLNDQYDTQKSEGR